jgi:predicted DNA-binding transcriptional regulator AlpA
MDLKMINLAIGKLSDDMEKIKEQMKEVFIQLTSLKTYKAEPVHQVETRQHSTEFITLMDIMKILKMSRNSVLTLIRKGLIREIRFTKRTIRYNKSEVLALAKN